MVKSKKEISHKADKSKKEEQKDNKEARLNNVLSFIDKKHGKGSIMHIGSTPIADVNFVSTGVPGVDVALGCGGFPLGRVIEVFGVESSGKTTLALHAIAEVQKAGGKAAFIDAEHALDPKYARRLGVKIDDTLISQPDYGEQALDIAEQLINSFAVDIIVIDSVAALVPKSELEGEMGDHSIGVQARLMSKALRKLTGALNRSKCIVIFINQTREKVGVVYGSNKTTTGGNALKFYASVRIEISKKSVIKEGERSVGAETKVKVIKNKVAPPFKEVEFQVRFNKGIDKVSSLIDLAIDDGIFTKAGSWYSYGEERLGQGKQPVIDFLEQSPEIYEKVREEVYKANDISVSSYKYSND